MTRLEGFRCDNCKVESVERPNQSWYQVQTIRTGALGLTGGWSASFSDALHYCSARCLQESIERGKRK